MKAYIEKIIDNITGKKKNLLQDTADCMRKAILKKLQR